MFRYNFKAEQRCLVLKFLIYDAGRQDYCTILRKVTVINSAEQIDYNY